MVIAFIRCVDVVSDIYAGISKRKNMKSNFEITPARWSRRAWMRMLARLVAVMGVSAATEKRSVAFESCLSSDERRRMSSKQFGPNSTVAAGTENRTWAKRAVVPNKVNDKIQPLEYSTQTLDPDSFLGRRLDLNLRDGVLKVIDLESYLRPYKDGKRPMWPAGEYLGKYMQAFSRMYLYSGNPELLEKMQVVSGAWLSAQREDGWVGTGEQWGAWDVWEHKYTLLGLLDQYELTGEPSSLRAAKKIGDLLANAFGQGRRDLMRTGGWAMGSASVLEPMVYLYRFTGEEKYLAFCLEIIRAMESSSGPKLISILGKGSGSVYDVIDSVNHWHNGRKVTKCSRASSDFCDCTRSPGTWSIE